MVAGDGSGGGVHGLRLAFNNNSTQDLLNHLIFHARIEKFCVKNSLHVSDTIHC